jgi:hypothetical protein
MEQQYLKYFAKYEGLEKPFTDIAREFEVLGAKDISRQESSKEIGFYADSEEVVNEIKKLEYVVEVRCHGPAIKPGG